MGTYVSETGIKIQQNSGEEHAVENVVCINEGHIVSTSMC